MTLSDHLVIEKYALPKLKTAISKKWFLGEGEEKTTVTGNLPHCFE
jgi:hypothetical protein